jgi:hypothetical protein
MVTQAARQLDSWVSRTPFHPWFFAAFPVLRLYAENLTDVEPDEVVVPLLVVLAATTIGMAVLGLLLRDLRRAAVIVSALVLPVLLYGLVLARLPASLENGRLLLLGASVAFVAVAVVVALKIRRHLGGLTSALNIVSLVLFLLVAIPAVRGVADVVGLSSVTNTSTARVSAGIADEGPTRDIYHLILDRYGSERSLSTGFDIDNSEFVAWLREQGFQVVDDAQANYARTTLSLGATLGMAPLDDIAAAAGSSSQNLEPVMRRILDSNAGAYLQEHGYTYFHIGSWFTQTRKSRIADRLYFPAKALSLASTLYDLSILPQIISEPDGPTDMNQVHAESAHYQFELLDDLRDEPGPKYVFGHILLPHPRYVFEEDGTYDPEKATLRSQLAFTNESLKRFLEPLLALPEEQRPIIILQADEGPYPRRMNAERDTFRWTDATDDELITKFGILDAWLMPGPEGEAPLPSRMTAINTYPELFRRYFGADLADLPDRVYASLSETPYDMLDITDRLSAAEATADPTQTILEATPSVLPG